MNESGVNDSDISTIEKLTMQNREATKYDFDQMELSPDTENAETILDPELISSSENTNLFEYEQTHLCKRYKGFFNALNPDEIIQWQGSLISKPLIKLPSSLEAIATQLFKNLMSYMGDRSSSKNPQLHIVKHTRLAMGSPEEVKDEAYLQVIKQITRNPNQSRCLRGWNLFAIMASCYPPSMELYHALIHYLLDIIKTGDEELAKRANYIAIRLSKTFESRRKIPPSDLEIKHVEGMKPIVITMNFFSGAATSCQVESYTTVRELKTIVMRKLCLNISRIPYFSIYEMCYKPDCIEERYLNEFEKVCDILAVWQKETENYKKKNINIEFKFFLKLLLYYDYNPEDIDSVTMTYVQCQFETVKGRYNLTEPDVIKLGAIQLYIDYGHLSTDQLQSNLKENITKFVPVNKRQINSESSWADKILNEYNNCRFNSKLEAKNAYLNILKDNELFQSCQFICTYNPKVNTANNNSQREPNPCHIPEECIVCVKPKEIIITDNNRNKIYSMPLTIIASWGVNSDTFVIVEKKSDKDYNKSYFTCNQPKLFKIIIDSYTNVLVGKNMVEIMTERVETCKLFESLPVTKLKPGESLRTRQSTIYPID
jgi:hypothetical protein